MITQLIKSKMLLWGLLSIPSMKFLVDFIKPELYYSEMMFQSGVLSVQLFVVALSITPITRLLTKAKILKEVRRWLLQSRRYFGVASFIYAVLHTCLYLRETGDLYSLYLDVFSIEIGFGWLAVLIMIIPAMTSNNVSMRLFGKRWKRLQQLSYLVAIAVIIHWVSLGIFLDVGILWLALLVLAKFIQFTLHILSRRKSII